MTKATPILLFSLIMFAACSGVEESNTNTPNIKEISANLNDPDSPEKKANDHTEELGELLNLPVVPTDVKWREQEGAERKLMAVIRFDKADADKLEANSAKHGEPEDVSVTFQEWFPNELSTQAEFSADSMLKGKAYPANEILKAPFNTGKLSRIEGTDYFIVDISVK